MQQKKLIKAIKQSLGLGFGLYSVLCFAEVPEEANKTQTIVVTGSSIKGVAAESALPITVLKAEELAKQGITTAEEAIATISANRSTDVPATNIGATHSTGSTANLRGLGYTKTLVLLNGRRMANNANYTAAVDISTIPFAIVDRIEVLRDGASAIYGADAIGGVINFITKKNYSGAGATAYTDMPEESGGKKQQFSIFAGHGELEKQGYNVFAALYYRHQDAVMASQRTVSERGGVIPELGVNIVSSAAFPANIVGKGNPYVSKGCGNNPNNIPDIGYCLYNYAANSGIIPESTTASFLSRGTFKLSDHLNAVFEYIYSQNKFISTISEDPLLGGGADYYIYHLKSPYYPGQGKTSYINGVFGQRLTLNFRSQAGNRLNERIADTNRVLVGLEGSLGTWDIDTAIQYSQNKTQNIFAGGYVNKQQIRDDLTNGILNPFGASADPNYWDSVDVQGVSEEAQLKSLGFDMTLSRSIYTLPAGEVGFAIGTALRKDDWLSTQNKEVNELTESSVATQADNQGEEQIEAIYSELKIPILKSLTAQLAARYDHYSDFGGTFNPKLALRWTPTKKLMFRSSYTTGFRAPSLYELNYVGTLSQTSSSWSDPVLCPNGQVSENATSDDGCNAQFKTLVTGNKDLEPETSSAYNLGFVFEPVKNLVFSVDYFNIEVKNAIGIISESGIFGNPDRYSDLFVRKEDQTIDYINKTYLNWGITQTTGVDVSLRWASPRSQYGRLKLTLDGTYVDTYRYRENENLPWENHVSVYSSNVVPRWKHTLGLSWNFENWYLYLQQTFFKGYQDQNSDGQDHWVGDYTLYSLSGTYSGFKNMDLTLGIRNLFDTDPSLSNTVDYSQFGYDPRYGDPIGRTFYGRVSYKF